MFGEEYKGANDHIPEKMYCYETTEEANAHTGF
jgi:hypothetical protein